FAVVGAQPLRGTSAAYHISEQNSVKSDIIAKIPSKYLPQVSVKMHQLSRLWFVLTDWGVHVIQKLVCLIRTSRILYKARSLCSLPKPNPSCLTICATCCAHAITAFGPRGPIPTGSGASSCITGCVIRLAWGHPK